MKIDDLLSFLPHESNPVQESPAPYPFLSMTRRLEEQALAHPDRQALVDDEGSFTYAELLERSQRVAAFIALQGFAPETAVAVMTGRNRHHFAAVLGIWRAGCVSVPLDPSLPRLRLQQMLHGCAAPLLLADATYAGKAERLAFTCPALRLLLCLNTPRFEDAVEPSGELMSLELWDHVTQKNADGSWKDSFTGRPLPDEGLAGMARNVCAKTSASGRGNVLDIGGGSGKTARALMERSAAYTAVELSCNELERIKKLGAELNTPVKTHSMEARDINLLEAGFDLIVLNSVTENFPGCNYLRQVLDRAVPLLHENGTLFVGMVWDSERRQSLKEALKNHAAATGDSSGLTRFEEEQELSMPRSVFAYWASQRSDVTLSFSTPSSGVSELDEYRYDVLIRKIPGKTPAVPQTLFGEHDLPAPVSLPETHPEQAAYIIYTSGSTGVPKGVLVEHGALMNLMGNLLEQVYAPLQSDNPVHAALLASFSFDASLQGWAALCAGGTLFPVAEYLRRDPQALHQFFLHRKIALCDGTPSLFGLLLDFWEDRAQHPAVKSWLLGGETLRLDHLSRLYNLPGQETTRVHNVYGPTECCVDATLHTTLSSTWREHVSPPIGTPLKGLSVRIRDRQGRDVPEGIPGELWIGGIGVARGYLHPQTPSPFSEENGMRWYRTGDIVSRRHGLLFYLSREDGQVKTGGYRVETAEVEAALEACPLVRHAAVIAGDFSGNNVTTLAAYLVPANPETTLDVAALRAYLQNHLPAYAIPAFFIPMSALPTTTSGKVDRKSLPSPTALRPGKTGRPPHSPEETTLAKLWSRLLGSPVNDVEADFFALGGHSVLGVRLLSLLETTFGRRLSLSAIFSHPTIEAQVKLLQSPEQAENGKPQIIPLFQSTAEQKVPAQSVPLFLFHPAGGSAYCYKELAQRLDNDVPVYAVEPPSLLFRWPTMLSVEEMAVGYAQGIMQVLGDMTPEKPFLMGGWSFGGLLALETTRLLRKRGLTERGLVILDTAVHGVGKAMMQLDEADFLMDLFGGLSISPETFRAMPSEERLEFLLREGKETGRLPSGFDEARMRALVRTFQYNGLASSRYTPKPMEGRALLIRSSLPSGQTGVVSEDPYMGWKDCLTGDINLHWVSGSHESILQRQNVATVCDIIRTYCRGLS